MFDLFPPSTPPPSSSPSSSPPQPPLSSSTMINQHHAMVTYSIHFYSGMRKIWGTHILMSIGFGLPFFPISSNPEYHCKVHSERLRALEQAQIDNMFKRFLKINTLGLGLQYQFCKKVRLAAVDARLTLVA